ncbi:MAG: Acyl-homoserine lactone acylase QuiP [bacterium]|nr:Acyl-homoserine lactone acylase QuiP [bacterium]
MPKSLRIVGGIFVILAVILGAVVVFGSRLLKKSLPQTTGEKTLTILSQPVTVYRDEHGVPHIFAANEDDLWRAAGYVAAQDRLWQMDFTRRAVRGTLSEIFGEATLAEDKFLRTWGFHRVAKRLAERLSPESRRMLTAYAEGVNAFITVNKAQLPLEFSLLQYKPEEWKIEDSLGFIRLMAFNLCYAWFFEPALGQVADRYGLPMAMEIFPAVLENTPSIVPDLPRGLGARLDDFFQLALHTRTELGMPPAVLGSNSWAVSGARTTSGKPLLANDPHLSLALPSVWYEMHLVAGTELDVVGVTLPGLPGIVLGHNRDLAWGFTHGMVDDLDFYLEKINPANADEYWHDGVWKKMESSEEYITVKGRQTPERFKIRATGHGPVVNAINAAAQNDSFAVSMRWTGFENTDEMRATHGLLRAKSWDEFLQAMRHFQVPNQNVIYADVAGNIGYYSCGLVPIRRDGKGYLPYRGWENAGDWIGMIPFEQMPHVYNPPQNFVATANNLIAGKNFPYYLSNAWEPASRIERITELLQENGKANVKTFQRMQSDVVSVHARRMVPELLKLLDQAVAPDSAKTSTPILTDEEKNARQLLSTWEFDETPDSVPAALFEVWTQEFLLATIKDELGDTLFNAYAAWSTLGTRALEYLVQHPESPWFDQRDTPNVEAAPEIALASFRQMLQYLRTQRGEIMSDWQWGKIHQLTLQHTLGKHELLQHVFNIGPFAAGGSANTINKGEYLLTAPYALNAGPSVRLIVDLADPETSWSVIPGGQSGQLFSPYHHDQLSLWLQGKYRTVSMRREAIAANNKNTLVLTPTR